MAWQVRRAGPGDVPVLALVAGATFLETYHAIIPVADIVGHIERKSSTTVFAGWMADGESFVLYAGADGTDAPVGYAVLTAPDFPAIEVRPDDIELRRIYTLRVTHGSGLGPALLEKAVAEARQRGCRRLLLGTHPDNMRARRFYERNGFEVIGERVFHVGTQRFTDPIYARPI